MKKIKIGLCGGTGKMGQALRSIIENHQKFEISTIYNSTSSPADMLGMFETSDIVVDFSLPQNLKVLLDSADLTQTKLVIGTTGYLPADFDLIKNCSKNSAIFYAPNLSYGVALTNHILKFVAKYLHKDYDVEILDQHQRTKKDAPSGTSLLFGKTIADAWEVDFDSVSRFDNYQSSARSSQQINFTSLRLGNVLPENNIIFAGQDESITISHKILNRQALAEGALKACLWIIDKPAGLYSMQDIYNFKND